MVQTPTLELERTLIDEVAWIIACDEVGRGALAGPVVVGASWFETAALPTTFPEGLRDSKLIPEARRPDVSERAAQWVPASALGWASAQEVDDVGIIRALGIAAMRAIHALEVPSLAPADGIVLLDGNHDYISPVGGDGHRVRPVVKGDRDCATIASASVIAKVQRDAHMVELHEEEPVYGWDRNKGYGSAAHREAIAAHGISRHHRASWTSRPSTLF